MRGNCVAGIDLALCLSGVCILDSQGFHPALIDASKLRGAPRLAFICYELARLVIAANPVLIAIEGYSLDSPNRSFDIGEASGVVRLLVFNAGIELIVVAPKQLKRFVSGSGTASKRRMIESVATFYGVNTIDDNLADAAGLAKLAAVYLTGDSIRRCELEIVDRLRNPKAKKKTRFKKERTNV